MSVVIRFCAIAILCFLSCATLSAFAPATGSTTITYQGQLIQDGRPFTGTTPLVFDLFAQEAGGSSLASVAVPAQEVSNGLFTSFLDFGAAPFASMETRWLQVTLDGTPLLPRQRLTATPFSLATRGLQVDTAGRVGIGTAASSSSQLLVTGDSTFVGNVAITGGLTVGPTTRTMSVNVNTFNPQDSFYQFDRLPLGQPGLSGTQAGNTMRFYAPLQLPHGSVITGLTMSCFDNISFNISVTLYEVPNNPAGWTALGTVSSSVQSPNWQTLSISIPNATVNNVTASYMLFATWTVPGTYHNLRLGNVQVSYTDSGAVP